VVPRAAVLRVALGIAKRPQPQSAHRWSDWLVVRAARRRQHVDHRGDRSAGRSPRSAVRRRRRSQNEAVPAGSCRRCRTRMPILWDGARPRRPDRGLPVVVRPSGSSISPRRTPIRSTVTSRCKPQRKGGGRRRPTGCGRSSVSPRHKPGFTTRRPMSPAPAPSNSTRRRQPPTRATAPPGFRRGANPRTSHSRCSLSG